MPHIFTSHHLGIRRHVYKSTDETFGADFDRTSLSLINTENRMIRHKESTTRWWFSKNRCRLGRRLWPLLLRAIVSKDASAREIEGKAWWMWGCGYSYNPNVFTSNLYESITKASIEKLSTWNFFFLTIYNIWRCLMRRWKNMRRQISGSVQFLSGKLNYDSPPPRAVRRQHWYLYAFRW